MPSKVAPNQVSERGKHSSILVQPTENDVPIENDLTSHIKISTDSCLKQLTKSRVQC